MKPHETKIGDLPPELFDNDLPKPLRLDAETKLRQQAILERVKSAKLRKADGSDLDHAAARAERDVSPARMDAGNYKKGKIKLHGLYITIENMRGSIRRGTGKDGTAWESPLPCHYGYIRRAPGRKT
jgi:hypothetical protein